MKEKYGDVFSWVVWNMDYVDFKFSCNINDLSVFDFLNLFELNIGFVFVGLNCFGKFKDGNVEKKLDKLKDLWFNFYVGRNDFKL